jgi:hypothetical protein
LVLAPLSTYVLYIQTLYLFYIPIDRLIIEKLHCFRMKYFLVWLLPFLSLTSSFPTKPSQRPPLSNLPSSSSDDNNDSTSFSSPSSEYHSRGDGGGGRRRGVLSVISVPSLGPFLPFRRVSWTTLARPFKIQTVVDLPLAASATPISGYWGGALTPKDVREENITPSCYCPIPPVQDSHKPFSLFFLNRTNNIPVFSY